MDYALKSLPDPRGRHFRLLFALALFAVSLGSWLVVEVLKGDKQVPGSQVRVFSIFDIYPTALASAKQWKSDAYLYDAVLLFWPQEPEKALWAGLGFRSQAQPDLFLQVYVMEEGQQLVNEFKEGVFQIPRPVGSPIDPAELGLDAFEALEITNRLGGTDFVARNQPDYPQSLNLEYEERFSFEGPIVWRASYADPASGERLSIVIDANTGEVIRIDDHKD
jgi:hypothetical protein